MCFYHISLNEIGNIYMQENSDHRSTIDFIFISDQLCNRLVKYCNMESATNFSDHWPIMSTLSLLNIWSVHDEGAILCSHNAIDTDRPMMSHSSYRWEIADLQGFYDFTSYLLQTIKPHTRFVALMCPDVNCQQAFNEFKLSEHSQCSVNVS